MVLSSASMILATILFILLAAISYLDIKYRRVNDWWLIIIFFISLLFMMSFNYIGSFQSKITMLAWISSYIVLLYFTGNIYFKKGYYGGADTKLLMALTPMLVIMGRLGFLILLWYLVIHPAIIWIGIWQSKKKVTFFQHSELKRFAFIPCIFLVFATLFIIFIAN